MAERTPEAGMSHGAGRPRGEAPSVTQAIIEGSGQATSWSELILKVISLGTVIAGFDLLTPLGGDAALRWAGAGLLAVVLTGLALGATRRTALDAAWRALESRPLELQSWRNRLFHRMWRPAAGKLLLKPFVRVGGAAGAACLIAGWSAGQHEGGTLAGSFEGLAQGQQRIIALLEDIREGRSEDPRVEAARLNLPWSDYALNMALANNDERAVRLYLKGGLRPDFSRALRAFDGPVRGPVLDAARRGQVACPLPPTDRTGWLAASELSNFARMLADADRSGARPLVDAACAHPEPRRRYDQLAAEAEGYLRAQEQRNANSPQLRADCRRDLTSRFPPTAASLRSLGKTYSNADPDRFSPQARLDELVNLTNMQAAVGMVRFGPADLPALITRACEDWGKPRDLRQEQEFLRLIREGRPLLG